MSNDVRALLPLVEVPSLVLTREEPLAPPAEVARGLAADLPDARLVAVPGKAMAPWVGDPAPAAAALDEFLPEKLPGTAAAYVETLSPRELEVLRLILVGPQQPADRERADAERGDGEVPREQHLQQAAGVEPHAGGRPRPRLRADSLGAACPRGVSGAASGGAGYSLGGR